MSAVVVDVLVFGLDTGMGLQGIMVFLYDVCLLLQWFFWGEGLRACCVCTSEDSDMCLIVCMYVYSGRFLVFFGSYF